LQDDTVGYILMAAPLEKLAAPLLGRVGGMLAGLFGKAAVKGAEEAAPTILSKMPSWVTNGNGFVAWLKEVAHDGTVLSSADADAIAAKAKDLGVDVRLDPPHPGTNWEVLHFNIGRNGQVHLELPAGYDNPSVPKGFARKP
jgi:hypothetical protein